MQAAHEAAEPPLLLRQVLHRRVRSLHAGVEERVQVHPGRCDQPEEQEAQRAQVSPGIGRRAEPDVEGLLQPLHPVLRDRAQRLRPYPGSRSMSVDGSTPIDRCATPAGAQPELICVKRLGEGTQPRRPMRSSTGALAGSTSSAGLVHQGRSAWRTARSAREDLEEDRVLIPVAARRRVVHGA